MKRASNILKFIIDSKIEFFSLYFFLYHSEIITYPPGQVVFFFFGTLQFISKKTLYILILFTFVMLSSLMWMRKGGGGDGHRHISMKNKNSSK